MTVDANGKTGRRPGPGSSRQTILDAARDQFMQHGYKGATMRAIAGQAGADPNLIRHFFGDKDGLFAAAMELPPQAAATVLAVFDGPIETWGAGLTRAYLSIWEDPLTAAPVRATLVSAFTNDQALERLREFLISVALEPASRRLTTSNPALRLTVSMSHLMGVALTRYILQAPPMRAPSVDELVALVGPTIQNYLTGPLPAPGE